MPALRQNRGAFASDCASPEKKWDTFVAHWIWQLAANFWMALPVGAAPRGTNPRTEGHAIHCHVERMDPH
jgi:hypothetical protein